MSLLIVKPDTVVAWHRAGFRCYWRWRSRRRSGRRPVTKEVRDLIRRLAAENAGWGALRIHAELLKLGFSISERTVARYLSRVHRRGNPGRFWLAFLENHREAIVALDFFTVPTIRFGLLYVLVIIEHGRRRILHFNILSHPTAEWVIHQLREAFPDIGKYRFAILDHDSKFSAEVLDFLRCIGLKPKRTSIQAPWQNGVADRWIGTCRRELLDHVIALNESHLHRLIREYIAYYHEDRTHDALRKRKLRTRGLSNSNRRTRHKSLLRFGSVDCIIATSGARPRSRDQAFLSNRSHRHSGAESRSDIQ